MVLRACLFANLIVVGGLLGQTALAQQTTPILSLPQLSECKARTHPQLPEKWRALFLMAPFTNAQLVLAEIVYDGSLPGMRVKLYGLRGGALDLFVAGSNTYVLATPGQQSCDKLGDTGWRLLPPDWLSAQSQCVGAAPLGKTDVDWWKTPSAPRPSSYWIWYNSSNKAPFRLVFQSASNRLAPFSRYALSYQLRFEAQPDIDLSDARRACQNAKPVDPGGAVGLDQRIAAALTGERLDKEIAQLAPELAACPATPLPTWPDRLAITGLMTPWDVDENPYGTEVFYDWPSRAQRTRVFPYSHAPFRAQDALLLGRRGYNVTFRRPGPTCEPVLPGTLRPDWPSRGSCSCEAMLTGTSALTPYGTTRIITCPLASPRAAWAWYALDGRPTSFAVTSLPGDQGFGLFAVLDYRDWLPDQQAPAMAFKESALCRAHGLRMHADTSKCSTCHLGDVRTRH